MTFLFVSGGERHAFVAPSPVLKWVSGWDNSIISSDPTAIVTDFTNPAEVEIRLDLFFFQSSIGFSRLDTEVPTGRTLFVTQLNPGFVQLCFDEIDAIQVKEPRGQ